MHLHQSHGILPFVSRRAHRSGIFRPRAPPAGFIVSCCREPLGCELGRARIACRKRQHPRGGRLRAASIVARPHAAIHRFFRWTYQIFPFFSRPRLWHNEDIKQSGAAKDEKGRYIMARKKGIVTVLLAALFLVVVLADVASVRVERARAAGDPAVAEALPDDEGAAVAPDCMLQQDGTDR